MAQDNVLGVNLLTHTNIALTTTAAAVTIPAKTHRVLINNPDATISVLVSFDGTNFFTLKAGLNVTIDCRDLIARNQMKVKSASGTPNIEILFHSEA